MRSSWKTLVAALATALAIPQLAGAEDVDEQLRLMQERMAQLEDKLQATDDQLEAANRRAEQQQKMIVDAGLDARTGSSGLSGFLSQIVIDGFVASSYTYNFNDPSDTAVAIGGGQNGTWDWPNAQATFRGENAGIFDNVAPHHSNANNFQVDQLWFGIEKPATEESRGGFRADIVYGAAADANQVGNLVDDDADTVLATGDLPHVYTAYAQYLAPIGEGILIKAGRYETIIGAESFRQDSNFNITRGLVWTTLQPVNHTGVLISGGCSDCGVDYAFGISNDRTNRMADTDNSKTGIGRIRWTGETASLAVAGLYGGDVPVWSLSRLGSPVGMTSSQDGQNRDADAVPLLNVVATWDPTESLSMWLDYTHIFTPTNDNVPWTYQLYGFAGAARYAITERTGLSTRVEYLKWNDVFEPPGPLGGPGSGDATQWSFTATVDHALTDNLTLKVEGRYDLASLENAVDDVFIGKCDFGPSCFSQHVTPYDQDDQVLGLIQLMYQF